ncbi:Protein transport protein Sec31A [Hordeum vulgare]|nr:Protein transport protein Sec31A [Hordeum vulgare]
MSLPRSRGRSVRTDQKEGGREPLRFYQQIKDVEDLALLVIPLKFVEVMNEWLVIRWLPHVVRLLANKWCKFRCRSRTSRGTWCLAGAGSTSAATTGSSPAISSFCASQDSP